MGMAWGVGGREARFLLGLVLQVRFPDSSCSQVELRWPVRVEGDPRLIREEWRRVEWQKN